MAGNLEGFERLKPRWTSELILNQRDEANEKRKTDSEDEGEPIASDVGEVMRNLFEKQLYTDVTFFSKGGKETLSAHRVVLAAKCGYFKKMLFGENANKMIGLEMKVEIGNVSFNVFKNIVKYLYVDDIQLTDVSTVLQIHAIAQHFQIQTLIDQCEKYIKSLELTEDNVCSILQSCNDRNIESLKSRCISYIAGNTVQVLRSKDFEKCSYNTIYEICELQRLNLQSEEELLEAVIRWVNVQPTSTKNDLMRSLLKSISFLNFTAKQFGDVIRRHPDILTHEEKLNILMYLNDPSAGNWPIWCNKKYRLLQREENEFQRDVPDSPEGRKICLSLKPVNEQPEFTKLTSMLQMKCIKGSHEINSIKFLFEDVKNGGIINPLLFLKAQILPIRFSKYIDKTIDSKETSVNIWNFRVKRGQVIQFDVEVTAAQSCKFLKLVDPPENLRNDHFEIRIFEGFNGGFFFISEVEYRPIKPFFYQDFLPRRFIRPVNRRQKQTKELI